MFRFAERSNQWLVLLLSLALVRGLVYVSVTPPWLAPDEPRHFEYVRLIYENHRLVRGSDLSLPVQQAIIASMDRFNFWRLGRLANPTFQPGMLPQSFEEIWFPGKFDPDEPNIAHQLHQPPLYYALGGALLMLLPMDDVTLQLYILRLVSVLGGLIVVGIAYQVARILFPNQPPMQIAVPAFVLFLPTYTYMSATVNNDRLAEVVCSAIIALLTLIFARGPSITALLSLIVLAGVAVVTKRSAYFVLPLIAVAFPLYLWARPPNLGRRRRLLWGLGAIWGLAGAVFLWALGWFGPIAEWIYLRARLDGPLQPAQALVELQSHIDRYTWIPFRNFWGRFGWENIGMPDAWYLPFAVLSVLAVIGLLRIAIRTLPTELPEVRWKVAIMVLYCIAVVMVSILSIGNAVVANLGTIWLVFVPQGRYWFAVIIPIAVLFILGLRAWVPIRRRVNWFKLLVLSLIGYDMVCLGSVLIPFFYYHG